MVILRSQNKITDFLMILAWASPFKRIEEKQFSCLKIGIKPEIDCIFENATLVLVFAWYPV